MEPLSPSLPENADATPVSETPEDSEVSPNDSRRDLTLAIGSAIAYLLLYLMSPFIPASTISAVGLTTFFSLVLILLFTASAARTIRSLPGAIINFVLSAILALPRVLHIVFPELRLWDVLDSAGLLKLYYKLIVIPGLYSLLLVWLAVSFGVLLARLLREFKLLLPIGVTLALVDMYVVFGGGLVTVAESGKSPVAARAMDALTVQLPSPRPTGGAAPMNLAVGFADFLFISMFFACFARFGIPSRKTLIVLTGALVFYMFLVIITGLSLPALIPIAVVCIGMNLRRFRYERSEAFALLYAGLLVAAILAFLVYRAKQMGVK